MKPATIILYVLLAIVCYMVGEDRARIKALEQRPPTIEKIKQPPPIRPELFFQAEDLQWPATTLPPSA